MQLTIACLLGSTAALVAPTARSSRVAPRRAVAEVFEGVHVPDEGFVLGDGTLLGSVVPNLDLRVTLDIVPYGIATAGIDIVGKKKFGARGYDTSLNDYMKAFKKNGIEPFDKKTPASYLTFGGDDFAQQLVTYCESNPFYASALTVAPGGGFEIVTFNEDGAAPKNFFQQTIATMQGRRKGRPEVNAKFSVKPGGGLEIASLRVRRTPSDEVVTASPREHSELASALLFELFFYASSQHATIHVFHYLMTYGLEACKSAKIPELSKWADEYVEHIGLKYVEVGQLLINKDPKDVLLITGEDGLGGGMEMNDILKKRLDSWGQAATGADFLANSWMEAPRADLEKAGLLTEFYKHVDLTVPFSEEICGSIKPKQLAMVDEQLGSFTAGCGKWKATMSSLKTWTQLMGVTGVIHGGTLSMTRMLLRGGIVRWRDADSDYWSPADVTLIATGSSTGMGMQKEKVVMGSKKSRSRLFSFLGLRKIARGKLESVLKKYNKAGNNLKKTYYERIKKRPDFYDVGFILTDYAPTGVDGKQLTMATYI